MLTKSDLQSHLQCSRKLWLEHNQPGVASPNNAITYRRAVDGNIIGEKAREQLGKNFIWPPSEDSLEASAETAKQLLLAEPDRAAVEVPMAYLNLYARADALMPNGEKYILRETKAKSFPLKRDKITPDNPEEHHLNDLAIQAWVMTQSGFLLDSAELNLLNNQWCYPGGGDYSGLFKQLDTTDAVLSRMPLVSVWQEEAERILAGPLPETTTGKHCKEPHECPFMDHCKKNDPPQHEHPIELLPDAAGKKLAKKLRETKGYQSILDVTPEELVGAQAALYKRIQMAHKSNQPILRSGSDLLMAAFSYPRYYFDFEGIDLPVPRWVGIRPYEQVPFQWSCHIERSPGVFEHYEFLDLSGNDPSLPCIEKMIEVIDPDSSGPIFVYYSTYERSRIEELSIRHPQHAAILKNYIARLVDLHLIVKDYYYHPNMRGSFSIKKVLPAIAPNFSYADLNEVQEGTGAQVAYIEAALNSVTSYARKTDLDQKLREYCRQDTWAMVLLAYFLEIKESPIRPNGM